MGTISETWGHHMRIEDDMGMTQRVWGQGRLGKNMDDMVMTGMTSHPIIPHHSHFILKSCDLSFQPIGLLDTPKYHTS